MPATLDSLLAIDAIRQLKARYFRYLDTKNWPELAAVFADDAVFDARLAQQAPGTALESGDPSWCQTGATAIVAFVRAAVENAVTVHHGHGHEIEILSPVTARGVIALEDWIWSKAGDDRAILLHGWGHYAEDYICRSGIWQIHRSVLTRLNVING